MKKKKELIDKISYAIGLESTEADEAITLIAEEIEKHLKNGNAVTFMISSGKKIRFPAISKPHRRG